MGKAIGTAFTILMLALPASANDYWCVALGEKVSVPLPPLVSLATPIRAVVVQNPSKDKADKYSISSGSYEIRVFIDDDDGELKFERVTNDVLIFKAVGAGIARNITLLAKKNGIPVALTTPISVEVREDRSICKKDNL